MSVTETVIAAPVPNAPAIVETVQTESSPIVTNTEPAEAPKEVEAPKAVEPPPAEAPKEDLSAGFSALARKEKRLQEQIKAFNAERSELEAFRKAKAAAKANPYDAIKVLDIGVDDFVNHSVGESEKNTPEAKLKSVEERLAKYEQEQKEKQERAAQEAKDAEAKKRTDEYVAGMKVEVEKAAEKYPLITKLGKFDDVVETVDLYAKANGKLLDTHKAAELVEAELRKEVLARIKEADEWKQLEPIKKEFAPTETPKAAPTQDTPQGQQSQTLTERVKPTPSADTSARLLSKEESIKKAARLLNWV